MQVTRLQIPADKEEIGRQSTAMWGTRRVTASKHGDKQLKDTYCPFKI